MADFSLPAVGKLNLFLYILGRREDGYHNLQTLFHFIDLADTLDFTINKADQIRVHCLQADLANTDNLIYKAAELLKPYRKNKLGFDIELHKRLPMGGGVGGGSSDAATTLLVLNQLWDCQLEQAALEKLAVSLGADVPVFVRGTSCLATGIGDQLATVTVAEQWYLLLVPPCQVDTPKLYGDPELTRDSQAITMDDFRAGQARNDFQALACKRYPVIQEAYDWLSQHQTTRLTGSGCCLFAVFDSESAAEAVAEKIPDKFTAYVTKGLNQSPVHKALTDVRISAQCV